tara:strand:+ start:1645 stop:1824 length:180 start_codon:yes stop_codon:yes gene_type:complete
MVTEEQDVIHRQGRGEMKYEVLKELQKLDKEVALTPMSNINKRSLRSFITILKRRLEKL